MGDEGTEGLGLLVLGSSVPGTTGLGLILSILVSGSSPVRSSVPEVVGSEDSRDVVGCLPVFFLPFAVPSAPVLLATVSFEALGRDEVDEVDGEVDLEPLDFFE